MCLCLHFNKANTNFPSPVVITEHAILHRMHLNSKLTKTIDCCLLTSAKVIELSFINVFFWCFCVIQKQTIPIQCYTYDNHIVDCKMPQLNSFCFYISISKLKYFFDKFYLVRMLNLYFCVPVYLLMMFMETFCNVVDRFIFT